MIVNSKRHPKHVTHGPIWRRGVFRALAWTPTGHTHIVEWDSPDGRTPEDWDVVDRTWVASGEDREDFGSLLEELK